MKPVFVNRFDGGRADSKTNRGVGEFAESRHFDIYTYPNRLFPLRGVETDTSGQTGIGAMFVSSLDGLVWGLGTVSAGNATASLYKKADTDTAWAEFSSTKGRTGNTAIYGLFVEYKSKFYCASGDKDEIDIIDKAAVADVAHQALAWTYNITQGIIHPKDDRLYIGYDNKIALNNAGSWTTTALTLPSHLTITALASYGNYLAIATVPTTALTTGSGGGSFNSVVYLWDRDTTLATVTESIEWGTGVLRVLNVLDGVLIGVSEMIYSSTEARDRDAVIIKGYAGGTPFLIKEISTNKQTTTSPQVVINSRVNFIYREKLYVSLNIVGGSTSPSFYGLWCIAKSKSSGRYIVYLERQATNDASDTGILAAAAVGDIFYTVHTANGTITRTNNDSLSSDYATLFSATSLYESLVNPGMPDADYYAQKKLMTLAVYYTPLNADASVTVKYRVDSSGDWTTVFTDNTEGSTGYEAPAPSSSQFTEGRFYEFRIESTAGAEILGFGYKYENKSTLI